LRRTLHTLALVLLIAVPSGVQAAPELPERLTQLAREHQAETPQDPNRLPEVADAPVDPRAEAIERLLARYNAPIQGLGSKFVEVADRDGYDWRMLVAIAGIESSFGKHQLGYNLFGWGGGRIAFQSFEDSIDQVSAGLAKGYISRGLTTPETINPVYCPPNPLWSSKVRSFMNQIR
jgi:hypothetical protein